MFALSTSTLLLCVWAAPVDAAVVQIVGPCSATPGTTVEFKLIAGFEERLLVGAYQTDVVFDSEVLKFVSYGPPLAGRFDPGTYSRLNSPGALSAAGISCTTTPLTNSVVLGKIRLRVIGAVGSSSVITLGALSFLSADGLYRPISPIPTLFKVVSQPDRDCDGVRDATDNCPSVYNPTQSDQNHNDIGDACETHPEFISKFEADVRETGIVLSWFTRADPEIAGFHLYRSFKPDGPRERLTRDVIRARGDGEEGASYSFTDHPTRKVSGIIYDLQAIDLAGRVIDAERAKVLLRPDRGPAGGLKRLERARR